MSFLESVCLLHPHRPVGRMPLSLRTTVEGRGVPGTTRVTNQKKVLVPPHPDLLPSPISSQVLLIKLLFPGRPEGFLPASVGRYNQLR